MSYLLSGCNSSSSKPLNVNIIHMNDIHSHLDEESIDLTFKNTKVRVDAGGYPRVATTIKNLQKTQNNTILLNAGDALQGTLYYTLFKGEVDAKMMNALAWDAFVLGNHEFDDGDINLENFLSLLNIPIITSNIYAPSNDRLFEKWKPYIIRYYDGEAVGIIGIDTMFDTKESSNPGDNLEFFDEIQTTQIYVDELEAMGVNKIILLSHFGFKNDVDLSSHVRGVDIIVGGHSHTLLGSYGSLGLTTTDNYPKETLSSSNEKVCIVQAWSFAKIVGNLQVSFDKYGRVLTCSGKPILNISGNFTIKDTQGEYEDINSSFRDEIISIINSRDDIEIVQKDPTFENILNSYSEQVDEKKQEFIGLAEQTIVHIRIPNHDYGTNNGSAYPLGSDVAPIVSKAFYERVKTSDAVILNAGGVRINIDEGDISIGTAYTLLPFSNTLYNLPMKGSEIHQVLEDALSNFYDNGGSSGSFPYAYALRYDIDMKQNKGDRVKNLEILDKQTEQYVSINHDKLYTITTISYLASGKDGYTTFSNIKGEDTYFDYANSFVKYVKALNSDGKTIKKLPSSEHCIKSYLD